MFVTNTCVCVCVIAGGAETAVGTRPEKWGIRSCVREVCVCVSKGMDVSEREHVGFDGGRVGMEKGAVYVGVWMCASGKAVFSNICCGYQFPLFTASSTLKRKTPQSQSPSVYRCRIPIGCVPNSQHLPLFFDQKAEERFFQKCSTGTQTAQMCKCASQASFWESSIQTNNCK